NAGIVLEDTPLADFAAKMIDKRFHNNGQSCDALKRLLVHRSIFDDCLSQLKTELENRTFGLNSGNNTNIGPVAAQRQLDLLKDQVDDAISKGATAITGGKPSPTLKGAYFEPTILANVTPDMRAWSEELFGPVLSVIPFDTEQEAIDIANGTEYGLGALVFSADLDRAHRVANQLQAGTVEINHASHWLSCNPFGGYKKSGMGREHGLMGFHELCQVKVISADKST
ncbi:MAG: aldehyde dehydrogenase family protein, partial [Gammaproteobacteria bacterium]|nr:aldehyde dehydrogenase family protein [Gammaproteobacteria bacterium]